MKKNKKKLIPKLKKSISDFLTDESGKITKKDALGLAAGAALVAGVEATEAGHSNSWTPSLPGGTSSVDGTQLITVSDMTCSHVSGVVNGHISQNPSVNYNETIHTHSSHGSHSNHGSGGWC